MPDRKVAIVSDSTLDLPDELVADLSISLSPVHVLAGDRSWKDRLEISIEEANRMMLEGKERLTTSGATPADWLGAYEEAVKLAKEIVAFSIAPTLSATYQGAVSAAELLEDGNVTVIDAKTILASMGLVVQECARRAKDGATKDEVVALASRLLPKVRMVVTSNSRSFAKGGGRYRGEGVAETDEGLPIFRIWELGWKEIDRATTREEALDRLFIWMKHDLEEVGYRKGDPLKVAVDHIVCPEEARALSDRLERDYHPDELFIWQIGPTAGAHLGPGTIGFAYLTDPSL